MAKNPGARNPRKKSSEQPDDAFIAWILETTAWARSNSRALIVGGGILVVAILAGLYYRNYRATVRTQAATRLTEVRQAVASGNNALARRDLHSLISQFDGTPAAREARILLARVYLQDGEPGEAIPVVEPLAADLQTPYGVPAANLLADAYEANDQHDRAESVHLRVADDARFSFQRRAALADAARIRLERGDAAGAATLYARLVEMTDEQSRERGLYEMRLAEARAHASSADAAAASTESGDDEPG